MKIRIVPSSALARGWSRRKLTESKRYTDQANLDAALAIVRQHQPDAVAVLLTSSDQGLYGFVLTGIQRADHVSTETQVEFAVNGLSADAEDEIADLLSDLDWDGVVGEDEYGNARVPLPKEEL